MKNTCSVCGAELKEGAAACWGCGAEAAKPAEAQAQPAAATPAPGTPAVPPKPMPPKEAPGGPAANAPSAAEGAAADQSTAPASPAAAEQAPAAAPAAVAAPAPAVPGPAAAPAVPAPLAVAPGPPSGGGFRPAWLFGIAAILVACAAVLWVVLYFAVGEGGAPSRDEPRRAAADDDGPLTRRDPGKEGTPGPWGQPWGGEHLDRGDLAIDPEALPWKGSDEPLIALVEFGDYECEFTRRADGIVDRVLERFGGDVRLVFVQNPLPIHDHAMLAARAAEAARLQDRFGEMHTRLLDARGVVEDEDVMRMARHIGLDLDRFERDLRGEARDSVAAMVAYAKSNGLSATPHFVVGGEVIEGAKSEEAFAEAIEKALREARRRLDDGKSRAAVYAESLRFLEK